MYQSIPYTAQIPAGTSFLDRRNLPYSLVGLLVVVKQIILKGKETIQLQIYWFWRVFLSERLPSMENFIQAIDTLECRIYVWLVSIIYMKV